MLTATSKTTNFEPKKYTANIYQKLLRISSESPAGPLSLANTEEDGNNFQGLCRLLASQEITPDQVLLTSGFGLPKDHQDIVPVRLPALILPGLSVLRQFQSHGLPVPKYQIYQATEFIIETNKLPEIAARNQAKQMEEYLRQYVATMFPDIAAHVSINFLSTYDGKTREAVHGLTEEIKNQAVSILPVQDKMKLLEKAEQRHSQSRGKAFYYAAANLIYNGIRPNEYPMELSTTTRIIIPIGGKAEAPFYSLHPYLKVPQAPENIPFFTHLGSRPTYYPVPEKGEITNVQSYQQAVQEGFKSVIDGPVRQDLSALEKYGLTPKILAQIY